MKCFIQIIIFLSLTNFLYSQNNLMLMGDSLINQSLKEYSNGNPKTALDYAKRGIDCYKTYGIRDSSQYDFAVSTAAFIFAQNNQLSTAITLEKGRLEWLEGKYGKQSVNFADVLTSISFYYSRLEKNDSSILYLESAKMIYKEVKGEDSQEYNRTLNWLCDNYYSTLDYDSAIKCGEEYKMWAEKKYGSKSVEYGKLLNLLCNCFIGKEQYQKAIHYATQALDILEKADDGQDPLASVNYDMAMMSISTIHYEKEDYKALIPFIKRQQKHYSTIYGDLSDQYERTFSDLGMIYLLTKDREGDYANNQERLSFCEKKYGADSYEYASVLKRVAHDYVITKEYVKAVKSIDLALQIAELKKGKDGKEYNEMLSEKADIMKRAGEHDYSKTFVLQSLKMKEEQLRSDSPEYISQLYRIAHDYEEYEERGEAVRIAQMIVATYENKGDTDSNGYAEALEKQAEYEMSADYFTDCEKLLKKALQIRGKNINLEYAKLLLKLSDFQHSIGQYTESLETAEKVLDVLRLINSSEAAMWRGLALSSLALSYSSLGNKRKSAMISKELMKIEEQNGEKYEDIIWRDIEDKINGGEGLGSTEEGIEFALSLNDEDLADKEARGMTKTASYASSLRDRGVFYREMKEYEKALEWIERGKKIQQETVGKNTLEYEHTLELIASCNRALGKFDEAKAELNEALGVLRNLLPDNHPDILRVLTLIANIESHTSASVAMQYAKEATYGLRDVVKKTFSQLGSVERNMFWQQYSRWFQMDLPFLASICEGETSACTAYDGILLSKGLLLNTETEMNHLIAESNDEELLNKYYKLFTTRSRLNKLKDADTQTIDSLEHVIETTEKVLLQKCKAYGDYTKNLSITWQDVKTHLNPEDVAIEFVEVHDQKEGTSKYAALVIRKEDQSPKWVSLFSEKELFTAKSAGYYKSTKLSRLLWEPLNIYIQNKKNIYFAPDGELYNIGVEYLPHWDKNCIVSDAWNMFRVSSTRQILQPAQNTKISQAAVYGGIKYDADTTTLVNDSKKYPSFRSLDNVYWIASDTTDLRWGAKELPATKPEVEDIDKMLRAAHVANSLYIGTDGTEASFKALSGKKKNLLHIATHGFYSPAAKPQNDDTESTVQHEERIMMRSGLLLAGANTTLTGKSMPKNVEDGVLTAQEIATLDFRDLDLVVMSACETGLGDVSGEGVFGLQRGFKKAGAKSLLMSLWKVNDEATRLLMTQFYKNLTSGLSKYESLRSAQKFVREYEVEIEEQNDKSSVLEKLSTRQTSQVETDNKKAKKKVKKYQDPKMWAAFILLDAIN